MTVDPVTSAFQGLRDALRTPIADTDSFVFLLSSTLKALSLHPSSVPPARASSTDLKAIRRFLPTIQVSLLSSAVPTFVTSLDDSQRALLDTFFVPEKQVATSTLHIRRAVALSSYQTIAPLFSSKSTHASRFPAQSRSYALSVLEKLAASYSIDELYWAVWSASGPSLEEKDEGWQTLQWEEAVKAVVGLPGKVANAVGGWKADGWDGDIPGSLVPRSAIPLVPCHTDELQAVL